MNTLDALTVVTVVMYFAGGAFGWALSIAAFGSPRYYPAISFTGMGIGLLPAYLGLLLVLREIGVVAPVADIWQRVTSCLVMAAIVAVAVAALRLVLIARKQERAALEALGC